MTTATQVKAARQFLRQFKAAFDFASAIDEIGSLEQVSQDITTRIDEKKAQVEGLSRAVATGQKQVNDLKEQITDLEKAAAQSRKEAKRSADSRINDLISAAQSEAARIVDAAKAEAQTKMARADGHAVAVKLDVAKLVDKREQLEREVAKLQSAIDEMKRKFA